MANPGPRSTLPIAVFDPMRFRADRLDAGLSQSALARRAGIGQSRVSDWEAGKRRPSPAAYRRVLDVLLDAEEQSPPDWIWRRNLEARS